MQTIHWQLLGNSSSDDYLKMVEQAVTFLHKGELVAFPTETVYGLGANALDRQAVAKLYQIKKRPQDNPLIVHVFDVKQMSLISESLSKQALRLANHFWPGPLTIIAKKKANVLPSIASANLNTIAIRVPAHPLAQKLLKISKLPIVAPSANLSGRPSPTNAKHVMEDFNGKIAGVLDSGATTIGLESTVIDCTTTPFTILRPGSITQAQIEAIVGKVNMADKQFKADHTLRSPGMKYRHYAPKMPLILIDGSPEFLQAQATKAKNKGMKVGVYTVSEHKDLFEADYVFSGGSKHNLAEIATSMYGILRSFDQTDVDIIFAEIFPNINLGQAIMNRLLKAADQKIISEQNYTNNTSFKDYF